MFFSFKTLLVAGLAACAAAAPLRRHDVVASASSAVSSVAAPAASAVAGAEASLADILNDVTAQITPLTTTLTELTAETATEEKVTEIVDELKTILGGAIESVKAIASNPVGSVLGLLDIAGLGQLLGSLLATVFGALSAVLAVATHPETLKPLLAAVGQLLCELLTTILGLAPLGSLVGSLLSTVTGLVAPVLSIVQELGITEIVSTLGL